MNYNSGTGFFTQKYLQRTVYIVQCDGSQRFNLLSRRASSAEGAEQTGCHIINVFQIRNQLAVQLIFAQRKQFFLYAFAAQAADFI